MKNRIISFFRYNFLNFIIKNKIYIGIILCGILFIIIVLTAREIKPDNSSGNLNNLGFATKKGKWTYFQGYKNGEKDGIYRINDATIEKINDDYGIYFNISGKKLYYLDVENGNFVKTDLEGKNKETVIEDVDTEKIIIDGNWIYYFENSNLCRIKTNGKDKKILIEQAIEGYEVSGSWIYYSYKNNEKYEIAKMKTDGSNIQKIDEDTSKAFFLKNNTIYYITEKFDYESYNYTHELYSLKTNGKNKKKICDLNANIDLTSINFVDDYIFYVSIDNDSNFGIYKIKINGKEETNITNINGDTTNINIFGDWIYYLDIDEDGNTSIYRIKTSGEDKQLLKI